MWSQNMHKLQKQKKRNIIQLRSMWQKFVRTRFCKKKTDDPLYFKDLAIRKEILQIFKRIESDFPNRREYYDYLENVEDIIYDLVNDSKNQSRMEQIQSLREKEKDHNLKNVLKINKNDTIKTEDVKKFFAAEERAKQEKLQKNKMTLPDTKVKIEEKKPTNENLVNSTSKPKQYIPDIQMQTSIFKGKEDVQNREYTKEEKEKASGWTEEYIKKRTFEEAFKGLGIFDS